MSGWRDRLQKASFRGAAFFTESTVAEQGRRTALHEYPLRDLPFSEDLGRKARAFSIEAYVIGPDYMAARDKLIEALEQSGHGPLVHPYRGTLNVSLAQPARITESAREGGMARFSLSFIEAGDNQQPAVRADTPALVNLQADNALAALQNNFASTFKVHGFPDFVASQASSIVSSALNAVHALNLSSLDGGLLAEFGLSTNTLVNSVGSLIYLPSQLAGALTGQVSAMRALASSPLAAITRLRALFGAGNEPSGTAPLIPLAPVALTTLARIQQAANQQAVVDLVRRSAIVEAARASSRADYASFNDADAVRGELSSRIETEMLSTRTVSGRTVPLDDTVFDALRTLRVAVARDIAERGVNLARLSAVTFPVTLPALVAAYRVHGDATRDGEIVARNKVRHPGFVPGGQPLEVLV